MFELSVQREFDAAHAIVMNGVREESHRHVWIVTLVVTGDRLDDDGLLCDFHLVERALDETLSPFHGVDLNESPPFDRINPTAELVAKHVGETVAKRLDGTVRVDQITITEAPGCAATFHLPQ